MKIIKAPILFTNDNKNSVLKPGAVVCDRGMVVEFGTPSELKRKYPDGEYIEYNFGILTPGLINLHHHLYSTFARGWNPGRSPKDFPNILKDIWWRLDEALSLEDIYYSAMVGLCDSIMCGVTGVIDHHSSQKTIAGSLSEIARAYTETVVRGSICFELSDRGGTAAFEDGLRETANCIDKCRLGNSRLSTMIGMHASMTLSESSLRRIKEIVDQYGAGCHFHLAEDKSDQDDCQLKYGKRIVNRFAESHILGPKSLAVHGIHLNSAEIAILKESATNLAICARSNQNNGVGVTRWWDYEGVNIGIGTDGIGSDIINEAKAALYIAHHKSGDPSRGFGEICGMLLKNNAAIFEKIAGSRCGRIAPGYPADMVLWEYDPPTPVNSENIGGHYLYGLANSHVNTVWVDGETVVSNGIFDKLNYPEIMAHSRSLAERLWARL